MAEQPWTPAQLDRLEDALEDLEQPGALERWLEDDPSSELSERLTDYRSILVASREAMPMEDVPDGLLDSVFAEARQAAAVAPIAVTQEGFWARMRRSFMVPALALAGTTVLVLWIGRPDEAPTMEEETAVRQTPRSPSAVRLEFVDEEDEDSPAPAASPGAGKRSRGSSAAETAGRKSKISLQDGDDPLSGLDTPTDEKAEDAKDAEEEIFQPIQAEPEPEPAAEQKPSAGASAGPASGRWDIVSRGDRARQSGDCLGAREEYALALEDDEPRVRARALAGIGLCDRQDGNEASADTNFERARELDGGIDEFISSQTTRRPAAKRRKSKKKSRPKSKSPMQVDPFG